MFKQKRSNLSWLFILLCIGHFPTFGMYVVDNAQIDGTYDLEELRGAFPKILETQPKFIKLDSTESQYSTTNGIYKLFPYYQKLSPEKLTPEDSRFIIHKHVISGQWQLTEFYAYPLSKNIKAFPMTEESEKSALLNNRSIQSNTIYELKTQMYNAKLEVKSKNETIKSLKNGTGLLKTLIDKQREETVKQKNIQNELESKLIEQGNEICNLYETQKELKLELIEKENRILNILKRQNNLLFEKDKTQKKLESKLIEKENDIHDLKKNENKLQLKLIEKENQIRDLESKIQRYKKVKSEQNKTNQEKIKLIQIENRSKLLNLKNKN